MYALTADGHFGNVYTTALMVLALTPPCQLLTIYQRWTAAGKKPRVYTHGSAPGVMRTRNI